MKAVIAGTLTAISVAIIAGFTVHTLREMDAFNDSQRECEAELHRVLSANDFKEGNIRVVVMPMNMYNSLFGSVSVVLVENEDGYATLATPDGWLFKTEAEK